jgi:hypothetical protein
MRLKFPIPAALALGLSLLGSAAAWAQGSQRQEALFEKYILTQPYMSYVEARLNEMEPPPLKAECAALKVTGREISWMTDDVLFSPGVAQPRAGRWIDRLAVERCGKRGTRNIYMTARGTELQAAAMIPGRTATSPLLQRDALRVAAAAARIKTGCRDEMFVVDALIDGRFQPGAPWKEDWTFAGCQTSIVMAMQFTPDGRGGSTVDVKPK